MDTVTEDDVGVETRETRLRDRPGRRRGRQPPAWAVPAGAYLASRLGVLAAALGAIWLSPQRVPLFNVFTSWDAGWYVRIAQTGYPSHLTGEVAGNSWAFWPSLPALVRGVHEVTTLSYANTGVVVGAVTGLTGTLAVWTAVRQRFGDQLANRSAVLLVFFPTAFVLSMAYAEGLFLTFAALCLYSLDRRRWYWAATFAAGASLTRSAGVVLIVCVVVAAAMSVSREREVKPVLAAVLSALPLVGWLTYAHARTGEFLAFVKAENAWQGAHFVWFTTPFRAIGRLLTSTQAWHGAPDVLTAFAVFFLVTAVVLLLRRRLLPLRSSATWWVFIVGTVLVAFSSYWATSILRFIMVVFPLFVGIAAWRRRHFEAIVGSFAAAEGVLALIVFATIGTWHHPIIAP